MRLALPPVVAVDLGAIVVRDGADNFVVFTQYVGLLGGVEDDDRLVRPRPGHPTPGGVGWGARDGGVPPAPFTTTLIVRGVLPRDAAYWAWGWYISVRGSSTSEFRRTSSTRSRSRTSSRGGGGGP